MDKTAYPSVPQGSGMNEPASLEATGPPGGGSPPNDPNMNNLGKFFNKNRGMTGNDTDEFRGLLSGSQGLISAHSRPSLCRFLWETSW